MDMEKVGYDKSIQLFNENLNSVYNDITHYWYVSNDELRQIYKVF